MPRKPNPQRREELEAAVADYVLRSGIADLSLRPVAEAIGVSTYSLVYHFGSKEGLVSAVLAHIEERERAMTARCMAEPADTTLGDLMRRYWKEWCLPGELEPYHRLFYEVYALSLQQPGRFPGFMERGAIPWLFTLRDFARRSGLDEGAAHATAAFMASSVLGALLVLLGTGDRETATAAVEAAAACVNRLAQHAE